MPYPFFSTILNTSEGQTENPSLILAVIKREMVLFYFKLISSLRRQHHFIQWEWMALSAIAENLPFAYLTAKSMLMWCFTLKILWAFSLLKWMSFIWEPAQASSALGTYSGRRSLLHVHSCCCEGLCYPYSLFVHSISFASCVCLATPSKQGTLRRPRLWLKRLHPLLLVDRKHLLMDWVQQDEARLYKSLFFSGFLTLGSLKN